MEFFTKCQQIYNIYTGYVKKAKTKITTISHLLSLCNMLWHVQPTDVVKILNCKDFGVKPCTLMSICQDYMILVKLFATCKLNVENTKWHILGKLSVLWKYVRLDFIFTQRTISWSVGIDFQGTCIFYPWQTKKSIKHHNRWSWKNF